MMDAPVSSSHGNTFVKKDEPETYENFVVSAQHHVKAQGTTQLFSQVSKINKLASHDLHQLSFPKVYLCQATEVITYLTAFSYIVLMLQSKQSCGTEKLQNQGFHLCKVTSNPLLWEHENTCYIPQDHWVVPCEERKKGVLTFRQRMNLGQMPDAFLTILVQIF